MDNVTAEIAAVWAWRQNPLRAVALLPTAFAAALPRPPSDDTDVLIAAAIARPPLVRLSLLLSASKTRMHATAFVSLLMS